MLYKFYKNTFKTPPQPERRTLFNSLYKKHGVELVVVWKIQENHLEYYMITKLLGRRASQGFRYGSQKNP